MFLINLTPTVKANIEKAHAAKTNNVNPNPAA